MSKILEQEELKFIAERYLLQFMNMEDFEENLSKYESIKAFNINENVFQANDINEKTHFIMRMSSQFYLTKAFKSMKINLDDPNTEEDLSVGNIGTPGRVAKMWCGANLHDDSELLCGRWSKPPRMASFPNGDNRKKYIPITKKVDLISVCSHHLAPFSSTFRIDGQAVVSYIPKDKVLGISKIQKTVNWISKRGWLQEDLTKAIYEAVSLVAETEDVYVGLINIEHSCESIRGANSKDGAFTSEYYGGRFNKAKLRDSLKS